MQRRDKPNCAQNATIYTILKKTKRYFAFVADISTFKLYFYCILRAECYTRRFQRREKPNCAKNATIHSTMAKTVRYICLVGDITTFKRYFYCILHAECYTRRFQRRDKLNCVLNATIYTISKKTVHYIRPVGDISTFKSYIHCISHA